jgi:hypothetical protein
MKTEPLAALLLALISLTLVMLRKIVAMNQGTLLNFHSRDCNSGCHLDDTRSRFWCKEGNKNVFLRKNVTLPHLAILHENLEAS